MGSCCYDYDAPEFFNETWAKARKPHKCCECGAQIKPGNTYQRAAGKWGGELYSYKTCEKCADLRDSLADVCCPLFRGLYEAYWEYLFSFLGSEDAEIIYHRVRENRTCFTT